MNLNLKQEHAHAHPLDEKLATDWMALQDIKHRLHMLNFLVRFIDYHL